MDNTRAQQKALDDELIALADRLKIGKSNLRLRSILKSKEPTLQVALDALKLTPFYNAFKISTDVPEIYMQEDMLKICPKLPGQIFEEPPLEEEILSFIRDLGHTGEIKFLFDVNANHQPWRSFAAIINKCLSVKTTALESLRLSRAQILWGMYHNKTVDYVSCYYKLIEQELSLLELEMGRNGVFRQHSEKHAAECADERAALANLIANLTLDTEENKTILKQLKKANASLTQELKECKTNLDETSRALGEATSSRDSQLKEKSKVISDLKVKEGKDIDTMIEMDKQIKSTFANPKYLKIAQSEKPRLYEIPYDTSDPANRFCPNGEETVTLKKESRSKLDKDKVKPYE
ncbi:hypothetical protein Tco_0632550 [Tanacetum coccineum]